MMLPPFSSSQPSASLALWGPFTLCRSRLMAFEIAGDGFLPLATGGEVQPFLPAVETKRAMSEAQRHAAGLGDCQHSLGRKLCSAGRAKSHPGLEEGEGSCIAPPSSHSPKAAVTVRVGT